MEFLLTNRLDEVNLDSLMDVYEQSNWENLDMARDFLESDQLQVSDDYLYNLVRNLYKEYIRDEFLKDKGNFLAILKEKDSYLSALRIYYKKTYYLIEALETRIDARRKDYGIRLMREMLGAFDLPCEFRSEVGISNKKSLALHKKLGFEVIDKDENKFVLALVRK